MEVPDVRPGPEVSVRGRWSSGRYPLVAAALAAVVLLGSAVPGILAGSPPGASRPAAGPAAGPSVVTVAPGFTAAVGATALGPLPPGTPMEVAVGLGSRDPSGLAAWVAAASLPGSPEYRHFLTAAQAAARFGAAPGGIRTAEAYFDGFGLRATANPDGLLLNVAGPSAAIGAAFDTSFEEYRLADGRVVASHPTPAALPAVAPWTGAFGLGNVTPLVPALGSVDPGPGGSLPDASCSDFGPGFAPCQIATAYDSTPLLASGVNGSGVRLAVVDAYSADETQRQLASDLSTFESDAGLPQNPANFLYPVPTNASLNSSGRNGAWSYEDALDLEWAEATAPGATVDMVFSPNAGPGLYAAVDWLVGHGTVNVISLSWGEPDVGVYDSAVAPCLAACNASSDGSYATLGPVLELAAAQGISVFAASGDCGANDGTAGFSTNFPASDPYVTGVGGTWLNLTLSGNSYGNETAWSGNTNGASAARYCQNQGGSGGGYAPFPRPWWQVGLPSGTVGRGVPDVALDARAPVTILAGGSLYGVSGTSVATPIWAGFTALADQYAGSALGFLNPSLYHVAAGPGYSLDFHDVVRGNNGYAAGPGWDPVTGLGSPNVDALVPALTGTPGFPSGFDTQLYASPRFGLAPLTVTFALNETGGSGTYPLQGVSFGDGNASTVTSGEVVYRYPIAGVYGAQGYAFDSDGNTSLSPPVLIVVGGGAELSVNLTASNATPPVGQFVRFTTTVSGGTSPYTYTYTFGDGTYATNATASTIDHTYSAAGGFCAEVVVHDAANPVDGGASGRVAIDVGGAPAPDCGNPSSPLTIRPDPAVTVRDAPADVPDLFEVSGGSNASPGIAPGLELSATRAGTTRTYPTECDCAIFPTPGNYSVNATAVDPVQGMAHATANLTVAFPLNGTFTASTLAGPAPLTIQFRASVTGGTGANASETNWSSGMGTYANGSNVSFTYRTPGEYLAEAVLGDLGEGNTSEAFLLDVEPAGATTSPGVTATIAPAGQISSGETVAFQGAIVTPAGTGAGDALSWDLGNGGSAFGLYANETYTVPPGGAGNDTNRLSVSVDGPGFAPLLRVPIVLPDFFSVRSGALVPSADDLAFPFTLTPTMGRAPLDVYAHSVPTGPGGVTVTWTWGDGNVSYTASASHVYYSDGHYTVHGTAQDPYGDRAVGETAVVVQDLLSATGGPSANAGAAPLEVYFSVSAYGGVGPPYSYAWTLGSRPIANVSAFYWTFRSPGSFVVTVQINDSAGDRYIEFWTIDVTGSSGAPSASSPPTALWIGLGALAAAGAVVAGVIVLRRRRSPPPPPNPFSLSRPPTGEGGPPFG
jgi:kumamolisin